MAQSHLRSIVKGITWRLTGTLDTVLISYLVTGEAKLALKIGAIELLTKIVLYYLHERLWSTLKWGKPQAGGNASDNHARNITKAITWRITGTMDTMWIAYFITGKPVQAVSIGTIEVFTKIGLFYLHERLWSAINWGKPIVPAEFNPYQHQLNDTQH